jgi:hypothetical protein
MFSFSLISLSEGFEHNVLKGAQRLFERKSIKYIQSEVHEGMMGTAGSTLTEYFTMLVGYGYEISLRGFDGPFLEWDDIPKKGSSNIFCRLK